jgi:protein-S-isoprenylcysteine O-methyltransferase Ste14
METGVMQTLETAMAAYFNWIAYATLALAPVVFLLLLFVKAPYGRHIRQGWGPVLDNRLGWFLMESPAVLVFGGILLLFANLNSATLLLLLLWQMHYFHRAFIYPWTLKAGKKMPWLILIMAVVFNTSNGYLNAWSIASQGDKYTDLWLTSPQFLLGILVFFSGMALNKVADKQLAALSHTGKGYQVPRGLPYRWISCPNYLGEIIQWTGWAIAVWSLAGWIFAIWTIANLVPRAIAHHRWYRETFEDYPVTRKALIPFLL